ncbi:hypothetical protein C9E89_022145, partial [Acinetobacter sichuanensis]
MASKLGTLTLDLVAKVGGFTGPIQQAEKTAKEAGEGISESMSVASLGVKALSATVAGLSFAGVASFANQTIQAGSDIKKFAELSNASMQQFQYYAKGAATVGIEMESFADKMKDMQDRIGDFDQAQGGPLVDFFDNIAPKVGVTIEQFQKLSGPEALQLFYSSLEKTNQSQNNMKFYMEAIISDSSLLIPLLRNGGEGFKKWGDAAQEAGAILSDEFIENTVMAKEQLNLLNLKWEGFKANAINDVMIPSVKALSDNMELVTNTMMIGGAYLAGSYIPALYKSVAAQQTKISTVVQNIKAEQLANEITAQRTSRIAHLSTIELANAEAQMARMSGMARLAYMERTVLPLRQANTAALAADTAAQNANNASKSLAARAGAGLLGVLGGPVGLGIAVAGVAASYLLLKDNTDESTKSLRENNESVDEAIAKYRELDEARRDSQIVAEKEQLKKLAESYDHATNSLITNAYALTRHNDVTTDQAKELNALIGEFKETKNLEDFRSKIKALTFINQESKDKFIVLAGAVSETGSKYKTQLSLIKEMIKFSPDSVKATDERTAAAEREKKAVEAAGKAYADYSKPVFSDIKEMAARKFFQEKGFS